MYPIEYTWIRVPTPVTTRSMVAERGSRSRVSGARKVPATIHSHRGPLKTSPPRQTRTKAARAKQKAPPMAGTATQWARCPRRRPKKFPTRAPTSGSAGMGQMTCTMAARVA